MRLTGFQGQAALVTGAAGGVGLAVVRHLADAGALDVTDHDAVVAMVADAAPALAVHAAGVLSNVGLAATTPQEWARVMAVNAGGTFNILRALAREMGARGRGAVVVVSSNAAGIPRMEMGPMRRPKPPRPCWPAAPGWRWRPSASAATSSPPARP